MGRKQASLSLRLSLETDPPADLRGHGEGPGRGRRECGYVVIVPVKKGDRGIHIVNLYGNPKLHKVDYMTLLRSAVRAAGKEPLVIAGDFNAPHPGWGYKYVTPKGRKLFEGINQERLTLLTEPDQPTRTGTSTCRDTCPDLTLVKNVGSADWKNLAEQLGSNHCILETTLREAGYKRRTATAKITDWDKWRKKRENTNVHLADIEEWAADVTTSLRPFVTEVELSEKTPAVDARLLHLWEARRGLTKRWKRQRHNKKIRTKIQELTKVAEDHAVDLARNNWYGICDSIRGSLGTARSWRLLRALIDPTKTKSVTDSRIAELIYELPSDTEQIMDQLARRYLCLERAEETLEYLGRENSELDRPVSVAEFEYELGAMKKGTAPGPDTITAKLLYNLEEGELRKLNGAWLMDKLGMAVPGGTPVSRNTEENSGESYTRNMQPGKDDGRRKARSEALSKTWDHKEGTLYVDCGGPVNGVATIAVANAQGRVLRLASVRVESAGQAEEAAIALAVVCNPRATVISDSQKACGNVARGMVCAVADRILSKTEVQRVHLIWSPGHTGNTGNEAANAAARGCILRDSSQSGGQVDADLSFNEALKTKKLDRRVFPSPRMDLEKAPDGHSCDPRQVAPVVPRPVHYESLPFCGDPWADVHHVTWKCKKIPGLAPLVEPSTQEWEAGLQSDVSDVQKLLVTRALHAQAAIGALK
ncbi:hypothetical protein HPB47_025836 [Ixodes persulcatus]|uniref:Uncharacterized protein n=1 Tax=Ixodes persulcatus TaxID=34615 RepID=A0AC60Q0K9_IXOPE|nr:hypothetical protein HPB47_025836 [Ixodes persulcatus]